MEQSQGLANYGNRPDGTPKGTGWFGEIPMTDGSNRVMTEYSMSFNYGNGDVLVPIINPTSTKEEIDYLAKTGKVTEEMIQKAADFGFMRLKEGKSPFITPEEQNQGIDIQYRNKLLNNIINTQ